MQILTTLSDRKIKGIKSFALLVDPDKIGDHGSFAKLVAQSQENKVDFCFVGGSLITTNNIGEIIKIIKDYSNIPVVLFPGSNMHIESSADAILFLSLISGRNPELLIGQHVVAAPILKRLNLEVLPTGYILVNSGNQTTVSYMSNTQPVPYDKPSVAACTAMAGEMLGLRLIYLDAGSGARNPVSPKMISRVNKSIKAPLIVGGGIDSKEKAQNILAAGADVIVVGNGIEKNPDVLIDISEKVNQVNESLNIHE
ncbi:geranylgeranylglyceryl/heptaprenylglyceryl phosphate synthase [Fulvivirgaceae bacterium BMA10]|uniref:Geranylgeranylglyceryl phosphate synthase n=1 Tax=Splendidivirga corallicola TaxID=3051826 RepID=A0ABT8KT78_9BACT|nr:geranylgeranylglyceryl/heptaprenylglyceryl phosphate synthase [Fulvivirgaceae bacterium BMA10]